MYRQKLPGQMPAAPAHSLHAPTAVPDRARQLAGRARAHHRV